MTHVNSSGLITENIWRTAELNNLLKEAKNHRMQTMEKIMSVQRSEISE